MTTTSPYGVQAQVTGAVSGQVAVGSNIVQFNVEAGGVVVHAEPGGIPVPRLRPRVSLKGRSPSLVGRSRELETALAALAPDSPVELHGVPGVGKSVLLKHLGHHPPTELASAVTYHSFGRETVEETLQFLYETFYETPGPFKPTGGDLWVLLAEVRGLVALDDLNLDRTDVDAVLDALPGATFLLASERRRLWGQGKALAVQGLQEDEAVALLERTLGRELPDHERVAARQACRALEGHPLRVGQLATLVEALESPVGDVAPLGTDGPPVDVLVGRLKSRLGPEQLEVLAVLGAVLGASLSAAHLEALVGTTDIAAVVEPLLRSGLVQAHSPRYSLREPRAAVDDGADWTHRVADHLAAEAETDTDPEPVAQEASAILVLLERLRTKGDHRALLRLSGTTERALMLGRRWGAWRIALEDQLAAARVLGDGRSEAWALHQLGTRSLCLGDLVPARAFLTEALALREALGDRVGAQATRHNLRLLDPPPPPPPAPAPSSPPPPPPPAALPPADDRRRSPALWGALSAVVLVLLVALVTTTVDLGSALDPAGSGSSTTAKPGTPDATRVPPPATGTVRADPASLRFDDQPVGTTSLPRTVTFTNATSDAVRPAGAAVEGAARDSFTVAGGTCAGATVPPGGRCTVDVAFRPADIGDRPATLRLALQGTPPIGLSGRGLDSAQGELRLDPETVTFRDQPVGTTGPAVPVRVTNVSPARVTVQGVTVGSVVDVRVDAAACRGVTLPRGGSCTLTVTFHPTAAGGVRTSLFVTSSAGALVGTLQGRAVAGPVSDPKPTTTVTTQPPPPVPEQDADVGVAVSSANGVKSLCQEFCPDVVTVTNKGPGTATAVTLTLGPATDPGDLDPRCVDRTCKLGTLAAGESTTVDGNLGVSKPGLVVSVTAEQKDPRQSNNQVKVEPPVTPATPPPPP